jgi:hypothetical protein
MRAWKKRIESVEFLRESLSTHISWIKHFERYPQEHRPEITKLVGTKRHHQRCAKGYQKVIDFLNSLV